jgi:hypothetical protein
MVAQNVLEKSPNASGRLSACDYIPFRLRCLIFFRADGWQEALNYLSGFTRHDGAIEPMYAWRMCFVIAFSGLVLLNKCDSSLGFVRKTPLILKPVLLRVSGIT